MLTDTESPEISSALQRLLEDLGGVQGQSRPLLNSVGQVAGVVQAPTQEFFQRVDDMTSGFDAILLGTVVGSPSMVGVDLDTLTAMAQEMARQARDRVTAAQQATQDELAAVLAAVKERNQRLGELDEVREAFEAYERSQSRDDLDAARRAARDAGLDLASPAGVGPVQDRNALGDLVTAELSAEKQQQADAALQAQALLAKSAAANDLIQEALRKAQSRSSGVVGVMHSTPVALGTVELRDGVVVGEFDTTDVADGDHHLILAFEDTGVTIVQEVTVGSEDVAATAADRPTPQDEGGAGGVALGVVGLLVLGVLVAVGYVVRRGRRVA